MKNSNLQLLVYGEKISQLEPQVNYAGVKVLKTHQAESPNYLFIDLEITNVAKSGSFDIEFKEGRKTLTTHSYELKTRRVGSAERTGLDQSDVVYLITPDRYANGDPSNDEVSGLREGHNRSLEYGRHGGDLQGIADHLDYIRGVGFSAIWLNPVLENDQDEWSYHGYASTDYYKVDPRFGSNEEYVDLSMKAREKGMGMIMDIIVNHCGSFHWWMDDPPFANWLNNQSGEYQETNHRKETLLDPYGSDADRKVMTEGWFVPAMPDLNQRNQFMSTYLIQNSIWWIEYADLAGIRQDTYSYPFREFMTDWTCGIKEEYPDFYIVGEEWIDDTSVISYWQEGKVNKDGYTSCLPGLMDFPLCFAVHKGITEEEGWDTGLIRLYQTLSRDFHYADPSQLIIFPDNHDMKRIFVEMKEDMDNYKLALAFIMTTRGIPQLYYGTEIAMNQGANGSHGLLRADFPGGWEGDEVSVKENRGLSKQQMIALDYCRQLINWRNTSAAVHQGKLKHYLPKDGIYTYFRYTSDETLMVVINKNDKPTTLDLDRFQESLGGFTVGTNVLTQESIDLGKSIELSPKTPLILQLK